MADMSSLRKCFVAVPYARVLPALADAISRGAKSAGFHVVSPDQKPVMLGSTIQDWIVSAIAAADCVVADVSERSPNIFFELGLAQAMGKGILLIANERALKEIPLDIREFRVLTYSDEPTSLDKLEHLLTISLQEFRRNPQSRRPLPQTQTSVPFYIDWDRLTPPDSENLCRELLSQMGFRRLDWGKGTREVDLIAELPKQDPDGFEYRELWLVSMGLHAPIEMLVDLASHDPQYLVHRLMKYSERLATSLSRSYESSITLLLILLRKSAHSEEVDAFRERIEKRRLMMEPAGLNVRIRIWDQEYLASLIHRFPSIGYKYFSDEGRIRSITRKSYEELYSENAKYSEGLAVALRELQDEKNKRVRAERDSIWKDISFSATHKIGNPIFAIETDLDPLLKRIEEERKQEAAEVVSNIRSSVEKAKAFVEQFKSLARAQQIKPISLALKPIIEDACRAAGNHGVLCSVNCPEDVEVQGDPERLAECFDELVANTMHWFDKGEKRISIDVISPAPSPIPDFLDSSQNYALIRVTDNGCGVPATEKNRIFDAFFTTRDHGTGLGLALVRRIIDGHNGGIIEVGPPGKGADFEIFLPLRSNDCTQQRHVRRTPRKKRT